MSTESVVVNLENRIYLQKCVNGNFVEMEGNVSYLYNFSLIKGTSD